MLETSEGLEVNLLEQRKEAAKEELLNQLGDYCSPPSKR